MTRVPMIIVEKYFLVFLKNYEKAIADYTKAIELRPDDASAYNNRGISFVALKNNEKAIADYTKAIKLKPDFASAYNNRGNVFFDLQTMKKPLRIIPKPLN